MLQFDSGPSLFSGLSIERSPNPLKHVLDFIGERVDWLTYDTWGVVLPEGQSSRLGRRRAQVIWLRGCRRGLGWPEGQLVLGFVLMSLV
jgi:hypothetical protein